MVGDDNSVGLENCGDGLASVGEAVPSRAASILDSGRVSGGIFELKVPGGRARPVIVKEGGSACDIVTGRRKREGSITSFLLCGRAEVPGRTGSGCLSSSVEYARTSP